MKVIWKRPDGFHDASPDDYTTIEIASKSRLWLHKQDSENYPFRISGGWQDESASRKLNRLVNLLNKPAEEWEHLLEEDYFDSKSENVAEYFKKIYCWLQDLLANLKGDTWECDIMSQVMNEVGKQLKSQESKIAQHIQTKQ